MRMEIIMKKQFLVLVFLAIVSTNSFSQSMGHITVEVKDVKKIAKSVLICFIFNSKEGFLNENEALHVLDANETSAGISCEFDVPANQEYAVSVLQDENGNRKLDKNAFGAPKEGWATTNNVSHAFKAPEFDESKVLVKEKNETFSVIMHY